MHVSVDGGEPRQTSLGSSASEEQAAERASAGAYVLGDRCAHRSTGHQVRRRACSKRGTERATAPTRLRPRRCITKVPLGRFGNLAPAQGQAEWRVSGICGAAPLVLRPSAACRLRMRAVCAGRALAVEVLGQAKVAQLEELVRGAQV